MVQSHDHVVGLISFLFRNGRLMAVNLSSVWFLSVCNLRKHWLKVIFLLLWQDETLYLVYCTVNIKAKCQKRGQCHWSNASWFLWEYKKQCIIKSPSFFMWRLVMVECYITCNWRKSNKHLSAIALFYARYPRTS